MTQFQQRVLITGGSGLLALNWAATIRDRAHVVLGLHERQVVMPGVQARFIDIETESGILAALDAVEPTLVVHTAGLTSVELCESNPELAWRVNVSLAANVARGCAQRGVALVHVSTDHLFPGEAANADEEQPVTPVNVYGRSKAEGELHVQEAHARALIVRTNFYGWGPSYRASFSDRIVAALRQGRLLPLFRDVFYTPILAETLVYATHALLARGVSGICHVVGGERLSKADFGVRLATRFGLDGSLIRPVSIRDEERLVRRPRDMSLSNRKAVALLGRPIGDLETDLERLLAQEPEFHPGPS